MTVLVWGELLWDRFPDGARLGGAPANVAWHLAQLGTRVALVTRVGDDDDGRAAIAAMAARGVDVSLVQVDRERATGEVEVTVAADTGEPRYRLVPGRAWERIELTAEVSAALVTARAIVFGTLAQRSREAGAALAAALAQASPRVLRVCDPNLRGSVEAAAQEGERRAVDEALAVADVVKLGEKEAARIAAWSGLAGPGALVEALLARGARLVALTRGADGSRWYAPRGVELEVPAVAAPPAASGHQDNVGCGDAYLAALVHGLVGGWPWPRIGRLAARLGAEVAGVRGATPVLDADQIARLLAETH